MKQNAAPHLWAYMKRQAIRLKVARATLKSIADLPRGGRGKRLASATLGFLDHCISEDQVKKKP